MHNHRESFHLGDFESLESESVSPGGILCMVAVKTRQHWHVDLLDGTVYHSYILTKSMPISVA